MTVDSLQIMVGELAAVEAQRDSLRCENQRLRDIIEEIRKASAGPIEPERWADTIDVVNSLASSAAKTPAKNG